MDDADGNRMNRTISNLRFAVGFIVIVTAVTAVSNALTAPASTLNATPLPFVDTARSTSTQVAMRNVNFYVTPAAALRIRSLQGEMRSLRGGRILFDDKTSFAIHAARAEIGLTGADLSSLMNDVVFNYRGAPLKKMKVRIENDQLVQSGVMHKVVDIPFEMTSVVAATPDGLIRLHPIKTRILGVDGNGLMRAFGLSLQKILDVKKARGVSVKGNDLYLNPSELLPPPAFEGQLTAIRIDGDELVQTFGTPTNVTSLLVPDGSARAYMYYKGGTLQFGKLLMLDAEMQIVPLKDQESFGFDLARYKSQLVAGYSKTLEDSGLEVFMASVETLSRLKPSHELSSISH